MKFAIPNKHIIYLLHDDDGYISMLNILGLSNEIYANFNKQEEYLEN